MRTHYPRTPHLPWSPGATSDDVRLADLAGLTGSQVVVTEKLDGENTTLYADGLHARSLDSAHPPPGAGARRPTAASARAFRRGGGSAARTCSPATRSRTRTSRATSAAGRDLLSAELYRAWEILESAGDGDDPRPLLCAPPRLPEPHPSWALASVPTGGPDEGRLRGRLLALAAALADAGAADCRIWPRPLTAGGRTGYTIGLGATPPPAHRLAEIGAEALRGIQEASLAPVRM